MNCGGLIAGMSGHFTHNNSNYSVASSTSDGVCMRRDLLCDGVVNCLNDENPDTCGRTRDTSKDDVKPVSTLSDGHWLVPTLVTVTSLTVIGAGNKHC